MLVPAKRRNEHEPLAVDLVPDQEPVRGQVAQDLLNVELAIVGKEFCADTRRTIEQPTLPVRDRPEARVAESRFIRERGELFVLEKAWLE